MIAVKFSVNNLILKLVKQTKSKMQCNGSSVHFENLQLKCEVITIEEDEIQSEKISQECKQQQPVNRMYYEPQEKNSNFIIAENKSKCLLHFVQQ